MCVCIPRVDKTRVEGRKTASGINNRKSRGNKKSKFFIQIVGRASGNKSLNSSVTATTASEASVRKCIKFLQHDLRRLRLRRGSLPNYRVCSLRLLPTQATSKRALTANHTRVVYQCRMSCGGSTGSSWKSTFREK